MECPMIRRLGDIPMWMSQKASLELKQVVGAEKVLANSALEGDGERLPSLAMWKHKMEERNTMGQYSQPA